MLNDEVDDVRIAVFQSVSNWKETLILDEYTTNCIIFNLWESNPIIWQSIYQFMRNIKFDELWVVDSFKLFQILLHEVIEINLIKFKVDEEFILAAMKNLGLHHSSMIC